VPVCHFDCVYCGNEGILLKGRAGQTR
jgi:uncharacterized Fe-S radical SAM superfamily protein PflX